MAGCGNCQCSRGGEGCGRRSQSAGGGVSQEFEEAYARLSQDESFRIIMEALRLYDTGLERDQALLQARINVLGADNA